jgi:YVTN family beta-propeller protein
VISRRAFLTLPAIAAVGCSRSEPAFNGYAFIANQEGGAIAAVDMGVMAVAKHIAIDGAPSQVLSAATRPAVYALTPETGTIHEIRTDTLKFARKLAAAPKADAMHLAPDENSLFLITRESRTLTAVKLDDLSVKWRMTLPEEPVDIALSSDNKTAAVSSATTLRLLSLTERSLGEPLGQANFGQVRFLSNGERLVAADLDQRQLSVYRVNNPRLVAHLPIAVRPENLAFNRDGGQLFVTGPGGDSVVIVYPYDIPEVAETILVGHDPAMMTASSSMLFITNPASGDVSVLNIATHKMIAVVPVGTDPGQVAITPDEQLALVLNRESGNVTVLNIDAIQPGRNKSTALVTVIPVGSRPVSAAMHSV